MRKRTCSNPAPNHGGLNCSGISTEIRQCNLRECPVNGTWSTWGSYSTCDKSCGGGWKVRFRDCSNPAPANGGLPCYGDSVQPTGCNMLHCPVDGGWSSWSNVSQCSSSCGQGVQTRSRTCSSPSPGFGGQQCSGNSKESKICNLRTCPVDGNWGQWSDFRPCDMTCGGGFHMRMRECNNPPPLQGGMDCPGQRLQAETCNTKPCPDETKTTRSSSDSLIG
ncbi:coadhesin-like [Saccostrea echinata]|uniref:coadhesin-like n=1 Tax=Saccostrea echinata TaxID=191078 RepID=UPI002A81A044|nr:coadhesin-like [Saccostrea echinata]